MLKWLVIIWRMIMNQFLYFYRQVLPDSCAASFMILNRILDFWLVVGQSRTFTDVSLGFMKSWPALFTSLPQLKKYMYTPVWKTTAQILLCLFQGVQCGFTCKWLPSGMRTTRWFCSSALLRTSPSSSSQLKTKRLKVSVVTAAGRCSYSEKLPKSISAQTSVSLLFWRLF